MAEDDITIPKVGKLPKKVVIPLAVGLAGFIAWRFWTARNAVSDGEGTIADGEFGAVDSSIPDVLGGVKPGNMYGDGGNQSDTGVDDPTRFTNNAQWTDYVVGKLQQSESWSYTDIVTAIGNGLSGKPTNDAQQAILRAALAVGGNPPSGPITIVGGGNTNVTVAPSGLRVAGVTTTSITLTWSPVSGATTYGVYRSDAGSGTVAVVNGTQATVAGLQPNSNYSFKVAAFNSANVAGPQSASVNGKTQAQTLAKPATPTVVDVRTTSAKATIPAVSGADGYQWFLNGALKAYSEAPTLTLSGLRSKTTYRISVAADLHRQAPGPRSAERSFKTK